MLNLSRSSFAPQALVLNPATAARLDAPAGRAAYLQLRTLAPRRSWRAQHLFPDGEGSALFLGALHLLGGGTLGALEPVTTTALWRAGLLLSAQERASLPKEIEGATAEVETADAPPRPWLPPENAGATLWRRLFSDFDRLAAGPPHDPPPGAIADFAAGLPAWLPGLLPADDVIAAAAVWRSLWRADLLRSTEKGRGYTINNDPLGRALLRRLTPTMEKVVGHPLRQSYSFAMHYEPGAVLPIHVDRLHCQYTLSLLLDYLPASPDTRSAALSDGRSPWPLEAEIDPNGPMTRYYQAPGDGLLFRGRELLHGRPLLADGARSLVLMLHWLDADFPDADMDRS
ncbi:hypothetical protein [Azospirillum griseum]|uniref:Uncharacterized protein n=1 Tax=Azospirillum griseum TaxID=2496639 RepID=A0A431V9M2_9PROT|nr:hypothetical protein [Azospirillum griseum]RTR12223.1 hypothetical protein EJ903_25610 [Azospirillum griseum]